MALLSLSKQEPHFMMKPAIRHREQIGHQPGLRTFGVRMPDPRFDESRFAQASTQMLETGDYIDIRYQDGPRYQKPVGIYLLQVLSVAAFSASSWFK